jgi:hypothetical protein
MSDVNMQHFYKFLLLFSSNQGKFLKNQYKPTCLLLIITIKQ